MDAKRSIPLEVEEKQLLWLFEEMLEFIGAFKCFEQSPSFFIVYAHENRKLDNYPAREDVVIEMISWFEKANCKVRSDKQSGMKITDKQLCILPFSDDPREPVDYVILCCSQLLGEYMKRGKFSGFDEEMNKQYKDIRDKGKLEQILRPWINKIQTQYHETLGDDFHHVLTEISLVKARETVGRTASTIIFHLNGTVKESLPDFLIAGNNYLRTSLYDAPDGDGSKYSCFLEMLAKLGEHKTSRTGTEDLVSAMKTMYDTAVDSLSRDEKVQGNVLKRELYAMCYNWVKIQPFSFEINVPAIQTGLKNFATSLSIETFLGEKIPIDQYNIEFQAAEPSGPEKTPKSEKRQTISMAQILDERRLRQGLEGKPKRILIQGRPGTGKSTLGRQILYHMDRKPWNQFDWILWVPLAKFAREKDLATFLGKEYFEEHYAFAKGLRERINNLEKYGERILWILDGWDEIHGANENVSKRVRDLANFENVIITSRSHFEMMPKVRPMDLILDTIGFNDDAIFLYVQDRASSNSVTDPDEIKSFLKQHQAFKEACRAPMHLNLLCSFWHTLKLDLLKDKKPDSLPMITMLYQTMVTELWRKDLSRFVDRPCDPEKSRLLSKYYFDKEIEPENQCLGKIAIQLFECGESAMNRNGIDRIAERDDQQRRHKWLALNVTKTSFLHNDEFNKEPMYSFVHQTFQEFFAAQSLVGNFSTLSSYIKKYKYDPRFAMVFRFVAGLLQTSKVDTQLEDFFKWVEEEPRDLLGPTHQRLVIHCLSQVPQPHIVEMRKDLEHRLKDWLLFECEWTNSPQLVTDPEFPDHIREAVLKDANVGEHIKLKILRGLRGQAAGSAAIQSLMACWLQDDKISSILKTELLGTWNFGISLPEVAQSEIQKLLKDPDFDVRIAAVHMFGYDHSLPVTNLKEFLSPVYGVFRQVEAIMALGRRGHLPLDIIDVLVSEGLNSHAGLDVLTATLDVLNGLENIAVEIQKPMEDAKARSLVLSEKYRRVDFNETIHQLQTDLKKSDRWVSVETVAALARFGNRVLSPSMSHYLVELLSNPNFEVQHDAAKAVKSTMLVSEKVCRRLINRLFATNNHLERGLVMIALARKFLQSDIIDALLSALKDETAQVRHSVGVPLDMEYSLPMPLSPQILERINVLMSDKDFGIKRAALEFLQVCMEGHRLQELPEIVVNRVVSLVKIMSFRQIQRLGLQEDLPDEVLHAISKRLKTSEDDDIRGASMYLLKGQQEIPLSALLAIVAILDDPCDFVGRLAPQVLRKHFGQAFTWAVSGPIPHIFADLYRTALLASFSEPLAWSFDADKRFCENMVPKDVYDVGKMPKLVDDDFIPEKTLEAIRQAKESLELAPPPVSRLLEHILPFIRFTLVLKRIDLFRIGRGFLILLLMPIFTCSYKKCFEEVPETGLITGISSPGTEISLLPVDFKRVGFFPALGAFVKFSASVCIPLVAMLYIYRQYDGV